MAHNTTARTCSVVVCTRNRPDQLNRCLETLRKTAYANLDVVVVDNGEDNARTRELAERWNATYLREPLVGVSRARNHGARNCRTEIVAFIDDDAIPTPTWLSSLLNEFADPGVIAAAGRIEPLNPDTCVGLTSVYGRDERHVFDACTPDWFLLANFGGIGDGANMAFRRKAFDIWPGFDVRLGLGAAIAGSDEHNAFFELIRRGHRIAFTPLAIVLHPFPNTTQEKRARWYRNLKATIAYVILLFIEQPRHRISLIRFLVRAVIRRIPPKASRIINSRSPEFSRWRSAP
jgi:cellulose synthase/poly-beta-1,6-N-acetylglucosamine synthase-like glycosyltransferase